MKLFISILVCSTVSVAQQTGSIAYQIPFASKDNVIELSVANNSALAAEAVKVEVTNPPAWLKFSAKNVTLQKIDAKSEQAASFTFSVDKTAEVKKEQTVSFVITSKSGEKWTKDIKISVAAPATFELFQNYPNPFNPTTLISYQLPQASKVNLKIFDVLGREVATLLDGQQDAGYYEKSFNARRFASGMYVYQLIATDDQNHCAKGACASGAKHIFHKKMMLVK